MSSDQFLGTSSIVTSLHLQKNYSKEATEATKTLLIMVAFPPNFPMSCQILL